MRNSSMFLTPPFFRFLYLTILSSNEESVELSSADSSLEDSIVKYKSLKKGGVKNMLPFLFSTAQMVLQKISYWY